jgi:hypothetical protein
VLKLLTCVDFFQEPNPFTHLIVVKSGMTFVTQIGNEDVVGFLAFAFAVVGGSETLVVRGNDCAVTDSTVDARSSPRSGEEFLAPDWTLLKKGRHC